MAKWKPVEKEPSETRALKAIKSQPKLDPINCWIPSLSDEQQKGVM
jgi:hypothetical protein